MGFSMSCEFRKTMLFAKVKSVVHTVFEVDFISLLLS